MNGAQVGENAFGGNLDKDQSRNTLELGSVLFFADEDGEENQLDCAEIVMWDTALDEQQVKKLDRLLNKGIRPQ